MAMLDKSGKFRARVLPAESYISEASSGALQIAIPVEVLDEGPDFGKTITKYFSLNETVCKNGKTNFDNTAETLSDVFGYYGNLTDLYEGRAPFLDAECSIVTEMETDPATGKARCKVRWMNPAGGGNGIKPPEAGSFKDFASKFGGRFAAVAKSAMTAKGVTPPPVSPRNPSLPVTAPATPRPAPASSAKGPGTEDDLPF